MASQASYGSLTFDENEVNLVRLQQSTRLGPRGKRLEVVKLIHGEGEFQSSTLSTIISKIQAFENAFKNDYGDFRYTVNGSLAHSLLNGDSTSGVRVVNYSFPKGDGAELAVKRTFTFTLQASYDAQESDLVSFQESIEQQGDGGPISFLMNTVVGPALMFVTNRSAITFVQQGTAVGYRDYPPPAAPVGNVQQGFRSSIMRIGGRQVGNGFRFFTVRWRYILLHDPAFGVFDPRPTVQ